MDDRSDAYVALGGNVGDRLLHLRRAVDALTDRDDLVLDDPAAVASLYESAPVGGPPGQGAYLNSVIRVLTSLAPRALLYVLQDVEKTLGRTRDPIRFAPRTIDLDLLLYDSLVCESDDLVLPHPRLHLRRFVLEPLAEIAPDLAHPLLGRSIADLAAELRFAGPMEGVVRLQGPQWRFDLALADIP